MALINHVVNGNGNPPFVFVHGFACAHSDFDAQVEALSSRHTTVAVDLRGHGGIPCDAEACSMEGFGADVADLMNALDLAPSVLVGHSMGCRVVIEAALQAPERVAGLVLLDGSQFSTQRRADLEARFATERFEDVVDGMFGAMFTSRSRPAVVAAIVRRAQALQPEVGRKLLLDMARYDLTSQQRSLAALRMPVLVIQTTYTDSDGRRASLSEGQSSPYLEAVRTAVAGVRVEVIPETGHFAQLDEPDRTTELLAVFAAGLVRVV